MIHPGYGRHNEETKDILDQVVSSYEQDVAKELDKYQVLRDLDVFVLDNSIRESTVGQIKGHTLKCKWDVYKEVKQCGFKNIVVAAFNHMTRVDDLFIKELLEAGEDVDGLFAFSEVTEEINDKVPDTKTVPVGLTKLKKLGLYNVIFEIDLGDSTYDFDKFTVDDMCALLRQWINWTFENLNKKAKILVNLRDPPDVMPTDSRRVFQVVKFLSTLSAELDQPLFGLIFEEPRGKSLPEEIGMWSRYLRKVMDDNKWKAHLLIHVHEKFGCSEMTALQGLMNGCNGIWASVCVEGAAMGNAASCVTLMNLIRLGNTKVLKRYNCTYLRKAAINVTEITTGVPPHIKQPIYGARALDFVLDMKKEEFDLADFFGEQPPIRITTVSSTEMILAQLIKFFGENDQFTLEQAYEMKEVMLDDLKCNRKEEYMCKGGLAVLFDRSGGHLTESMSEVIANDEVTQPHARHLLEEIRKRWDLYDNHDEVQGDERLQFDSFYDGFMAPYFSCYRCSDSKKALQALDMDKDGYVDWKEFMVYIKWAIHQYPDTPDADSLLDVAFCKGLIPAMRDEMLAK